MRSGLSLRDLAAFRRAHCEKEPAKPLVEKSVFQTHGVDETGATFADKLTKRLHRQQLLSFFSLPPCFIAMEACGTAHH
jgi:transposase